ncbi:hypothetical protein CPB83DRAFT_115167 [Crepidotus variabilis]|uniref:Uncharacterized protein n=1 Tax=Crepidotus variabilis TaxID=179855 RepID=A0A9P6E4Q6_9AGAR|nr:hypothetical protein CPB83DRAFT_115167 [Crepidotus variabilis]
MWYSHLHQPRSKAVVLHPESPPRNLSFRPTRYKNRSSVLGLMWSSQRSNYWIIIARDVHRPRTMPLLSLLQLSLISIRERVLKIALSKLVDNIASETPSTKEKPEVEPVKTESRLTSKIPVVLKVKPSIGGLLIFRKDSAATALKCASSKVSDVFELLKNIRKTSENNICEGVENTSKCECSPDAQGFQVSNAPSVNHRSTPLSDFPSPFNDQCSS